MNFKPRIYADTSTKPTIIDYSDLVRRTFYEGIYNDNLLFIDGKRLRNKYDAYCEKRGKKSCFLGIVFRGEDGIESVTMHFEDDQLKVAEMVSIAIMDNTLKQMKETGEFRQLLGLLYL